MQLLGDCSSLLQPCVIDCFLKAWELLRNMCRYMERPCIQPSWRSHAAHGRQRRVFMHFHASFVEQTNVRLQTWWPESDRGTDQAEPFVSSAVFLVMVCVGCFGLRLEVLLLLRVGGRGGALSWWQESSTDGRHHRRGLNIKNMLMRICTRAPSLRRRSCPCLSEKTSTKPHVDVP